MAFQRRLRRLLIVVAIGLAAVWLRVVQLQVVEGDRWTEAARKLRERVVVIEGPRGRIVDRDGKVLAVDRPVFQLAVMGWEWERRARRRCTACGAVHYHDPRRRPRRRTCPCGDEGSRLEPLAAQDVTPLEDILELPAGDLAHRADKRLARIEELVTALRLRLEREELPAFLVHDKTEQRRTDLLHRPYVILPRLPEEAVRLLELDEDGRYRGFRVKTVLRRHYPPGGPASQLLGYVSVVRDEKELAQLRTRFSENVSLDTRIGRAGLERGLEEMLIGRFGREHQTRDRDGAFTVVVRAEPPRRGKEVRLALTSAACLRAEKVLRYRGNADGYFPRAQPSGGFVAMYADTGEVVAWGEMPHLDVTKDLDRLFSDADALARFDTTIGQWNLPDDVDLPRGETVESWRRRLSKPAPLHLSRVSQIAVEPGSTFKVFIGLGLLDGLRHMSPGAALPFRLQFGCTGRHHKPGCHPHSPVDFVHAICVSCNRYFAMSLRDFRTHWPVYRRTVPVLLTRLGMGRITGLDAWGETRGVFLRDYADFDVRQVAYDTLRAVRKARHAASDAFVMRTQGNIPSTLAGRDPRRLAGLLETVLTAAHTVAGEGGRVAMNLQDGQVRERLVDIRFEIHAFPHPQGPPPTPVSLQGLRRAVRALGGALEAEMRPDGGVAFTFTLTYHQAVGRKLGDPPVILPDDGRNVAIGQGPVSVTPIQMVRAVAALANGGRLVTPRVAVSAGGVPLSAPSTVVGLDPRDVDLVRAGMRDVVTDPEGTASRAPWRNVPAEVYGKTGTAQVGSWWKPGEPAEKGPWHHWFIGFAEAPGFRPLAFACVLHSRKEGGASATSAKAVCDFLSWWFTQGPDVR